MDVGTSHRIVAFLGVPRELYLSDGLDTSDLQKSRQHGMVSKNVLFSMRLLTLKGVIP